MTQKTTCNLTAKEQESIDTGDSLESLVAIV
jgi:hypothetical protein